MARHPVVRQRRLRVRHVDVDVGEMIEMIIVVGCSSLVVLAIPALPGLHLLGLHLLWLNLNAHLVQVPPQQPVLRAGNSNLTAVLSSNANNSSATACSSCPTQQSPVAAAAPLLPWC